MPDHPNVEIIRRAYTAFMASDMDTVSALFDDGITWHFGGNSELSGDFVGKQDVFARLQRVGELTQGSRRFEIHTILADDEHAVALVEGALDHPKPYRGREVHVWHLRDGLATEFWAFFEDQAAFEAALNA